MKEKGMKYVEALVTGEGYFFDPQKMTRKQKEQAEKWLIEDEILQAKIEKGLITEEEAKGKFHYKDYKLKNKEYLIKEKRREENDLNKRIDHLQKTINDLKIIKLDLENEIKNFKLEISDWIRDELERFRINALGMSGEEIKTYIKIIDNKFEEKIEKERGEVDQIIAELDEEIESRI